MPASTLIVAKSYAELRRAVEIAMVRGQQAVEQAKVRTYWDTGRLIHEHLLVHKERAEYGAKLIPRLGEDLDMDPSVLHRCVRFVQSFPIVATWPQLTWAHFRLLIPVADPKQRNALATEANRNGWSCVQLEQQLRALAPPERDAPTLAAEIGRLLVPKRGRPGVYRVVARGAELAVDLGFKLYRPLAEEGEFKPGDFVRVDVRGRTGLAEGATKADLFTFTAKVRRVIDGDTLVVEIMLPGGTVLEEKLRLRAIDCPEMDTTEGRAAKRFTETQIARAREVTISTTKPDKYDRYLSDVFLRGEDGAEVFLNNALLAAAHAVRKETYAPTDWEV